MFNLSDAGYTVVWELYCSPPDQVQTILEILDSPTMQLIRSRDHYRGYVFRQPSRYRRSATVVGDDDTVCVNPDTGSLFALYLTDLFDNFLRAAVIYPNSSRCPTVFGGYTRS